MSPVHSRARRVICPPRVTRLFARSTGHLSTCHPFIRSRRINCPRVTRLFVRSRRKRRRSTEAYTYSVYVHVHSVYRQTFGPLVHSFVRSLVYSSIHPTTRWTNRPMNGKTLVSDGGGEREAYDNRRVSEGGLNPWWDEWNNGPINGPMKGRMDQ